MAKLFVIALVHLVVKIFDKEMHKINKRMQVNCFLCIRIDPGTTAWKIRGERAMYYKKTTGDNCSHLISSL